MSKNNMVRLGVIGLGNIAQQHIANIVGGDVPDCEITALCARGPSPLADQLGVVQFSDHHELIQSKLCDAVIIATPSFHHFAAGSDALRAGLHVMMEKPLGLSVGEGEQLVDMQQSGQVFALMLNQRADPLFCAMRDVLEQKTIGKITRTHWTMTHWFRPEIYFKVSDWRATWAGEGGGLLLNQCIHNLDIFQWLCGMPTRVRGMCRFGRYHDIEVEDEATAYFEYANGASGVFVGSTGEAPGVNRFDILGDGGALQFDGEKLTLTCNEPSTSQYSAQTNDMFGMPVSTVTDITPVRTANQHARLLANFIASIHGEEQLIAAASEGLHSLALANGMLQSTWEDRTVELPLDSESYGRALQQRLQGSSLREKSNVEAHIDMGASFR